MKLNKLKDEMEIKPGEIILPITAVERIPNAFEQACNICGVDPQKTKFSIIWPHYK